MEVQNPSCYNQSYPLTRNCYSSYTYNDCGNDRGVVSQHFNCSSFLPPILDGALHSKRTERFTSCMQKEKPKILRPSKHGYHRRGNSPTFKVLAEVSEKLQVLVDRQAAKIVASSGNSKGGGEMDSGTDGYFGDCSSTPDEEQGSVSPPCSNGGIMLELNDYSSDVSPLGSITLTPLLPVRHFQTRNASVQLHFYLPQLTETAKRDESSQDRPWSTTNDNSGDSRNQDYANFYDVRHGCLEDEEERKSCDYKRTCTTYSKSGLKSGHRKNKSKKSKVARESGKKHKKSVLPNISRDVIASDKDKGIQREKVDFLNDVTTLISEQKDLLPFPKASYKLPELFQNGDVPKDDAQEGGRCFTNVSPSFSHRLSCNPANVDSSKGLTTKSDCPICKYKVSPPGKFVDRLCENDDADTDDLNNNNSRSVELLNCVSKC